MNTGLGICCTAVKFRRVSSSLPAAKNTLKCNTRLKDVGEYECRTGFNPTINRKSRLLLITTIEVCRSYATFSLFCRIAKTTLCKHYKECLLVHANVNIYRSRNKDELIFGLLIEVPFILRMPSETACFKTYRAILWRDTIAENQQSLARFVMNPSQS